MKINESFWAAVGKIGAIAGLLATVVGLWTFYSAPRGDLVADLHFGPQFWPPEAKIERQKMLELVEPERLAQLASDSADEEETPPSADEEKTPPSADEEEAPPSVHERSFSVEEVSVELGYHLKQEILESNIGEYTRLGGYWIADIRNEGDLSVDGAAINLPGTVVAVTAAGGDTIIGDESKPASVESGVVQLGTLRPNGKVRVIAWTRNEPSDFSVKEVVLSHQGGVGSLVVYSVRPPLAVAIKNNWYMLLSLAGLLASIVATVGILASWLGQHRKAAKEIKEKNAMGGELEQLSGESIGESPANPRAAPDCRDRR